jgi:hypothetical protein
MSFFRLAAIIFCSVCSAGELSELAGRVESFWSGHFYRCSESDQSVVWVSPPHDKNDNFVVYRDVRFHLRTEKLWATDTLNGVDIRAKTWWEATAFRIRSRSGEWSSWEPITSVTEVSVLRQNGAWKIEGSAPKLLAPFSCSDLQRK